MEAQEYIQKHPIECMFFSEFHHKQGPKITHQFPPNYVTNERELLQAVQDYLIPKSGLKQKLITVNAIGKKVIGCPVFIDDPHYQRNGYIFNFGLVLANIHKSSPCIPLIKKLSSYMTELERESYFVSNETTKSLIPEILKKMLTELNEKGSCSIPVNKSTTIYLKVFPPCISPPDVYDHHVPILTISKDDFDLEEWDLTTQLVLPFIDGFRHVKKIAMLADADPNLIRICIQNLAFYNQIKLISIFQYSNMYITTAKLNQIMENPRLQSECLRFIAKKGHQLPTLHDVMTLYCGLSPGVKVQDLCLRHQNEMTRVNEQKLIQFGLIHNLIRRIHMYPVKISTDFSYRGQTELQRYTTGQHSAEEVCCQLGISHSELLSRIERDPNIAICWK
ncbi:unnamed protein product [Clavelina lepadiformis]|uniref:Nitrogen permease regulator 2-like protein n=1 Tax=Clavelina lepadiformis TaxID=159417 RepID=A0ABP0GC32_CLALP